jgi:predicted phosphodiesterase
VRTLVVSDLHLGASRRPDLLRDAAALEPLLATLSDVEQLVLLGDVIELRQGPARQALAVARPVLEAIAEALPPHSTVVLVPGNHDHHLLAAWFERRAQDEAPTALGLQTEVDWREGEMLATLAGWLAPHELSVAYPGVWLRDDVYAMHGHYADCHTTVPMFERLGAGAMARLVGSGNPGGAERYEAILAPIYAWLYAVAQRRDTTIAQSSHGPSARVWRALSADTHGGWRRRVSRAAVGAAFPVVIAGLDRAGLGPLRSDISGPALRRSALIAVGEVIDHLEIDADHVIFGHTHRAGPLPGDDRTEWRAPAGASLLNTGCWIHEPAFLGPRPQDSPYRAGFAVALEDTGPPELINLLDARQPARPGVKHTA